MVIQTPSNQQRHTNIAIIKYKVGKKKFEIAAYKEKVMDYRKGLEKDIDNVLQTDAIFNKISDGAFANQKDLSSAFKTTDTKKICEIILKQGQIQISPKEREQLYDNLKKDIIYYIVSQCVSQQTGRPYPAGMIEREMKKIHFAIKPNKSAKVQAIALIKQLATYLPIVRARMALRLDFSVVCNAALAQKDTKSLETLEALPKSMPSSIKEFLKEQLKTHVEQKNVTLQKYQFVKNQSSSSFLKAEFSDDEEDEEEEDNSGEETQTQQGCTLQLYILADPGVFRSLDEQMESQKLGVVTILETAVQETGDLGIHQIKVQAHDLVASPSSHNSPSSTSTSSPAPTSENDENLKAKNEPITIQQEETYETEEEELAALMNKPKKSLTKSQKRRLKSLRKSLL